RGRARIPTAPARAAGDSRASPLPRAWAQRDRRGARHPGRYRPLEAPLRPPGDARGPRGRCAFVRHGPRAVVMTGRTAVQRVHAQSLAPDPDRLPARVIEAALDQINDSPQIGRGVVAPWRTSQMNLVSRLATAAIVAVVVIGGGIYIAASRPNVGHPT